MARVVATRARGAEPPPALAFVDDALVPGGPASAAGRHAAGGPVDMSFFEDDDATLLAELLDERSPSAAARPAAAPNCLNQAHRRGCTECTLAPSPEEAHLYKLSGDAGRKNGEKKLRALIAAQEQWKLAPEREALAARAALSGESELAQALRRRDTSLLRKRHLLYLAHAWGLRSDLWRRKQRAATAVRQDAQLAPPQAPLQPLLLLPAPASPLREAALTRELQLRTYATGNMPHLRVQAATLTSGAEAVRAIRATHAYALVTPFALDEWRGVLAVNQPLLVACCSTRAKMAELRAAPRAYDDDAPAWLALQGNTSPVEALLEQVRQVYAIGMHLIQTRSAARWRDRQPTAVERVYFEEPLESARVSLEFVARGSAALAQLRLGRAEDYLLAAEAVAQEVGDIMHQQDLAAQERLRWLSDFLTMRDTEEARTAAATVAPPNFPVLEAEAAKAMPVNWNAMAAKFAT